jgi:hypothetical protein
MIGEKHDAFCGTHIPDRRGEDLSAGASSKGDQHQLLTDKPMKGTLEDRADEPVGLARRATRLCVRLICCDHVDRLLSGRVYALTIGI